MTGAAGELPSARAGSGWALVLLLSFTHLLSSIDRMLLAVAIEPAKADLGLSDTAVGLIQGTAFGIFYSLAMLPFAGLADRDHRRLLIAAAVACWSLATIWCGLARSPVELFTGRAALGVAQAAFVPAAVAMIAAALSPGSLGRGMALFTGGASLGRPAALIGGAALFAALTAHGASFPVVGSLPPWRGLFVIMGAAGMILAATMLTLPDPRPPQHDERPGLREAIAYMRPRAWAFGFHLGAMACVILVIQVIAVWAVPYFMRGFALSLPQAAAATGGILLLTGPMGHLGGGALTDWLQARGIRAPAAPVIALGLAGVGVATLGLASAGTSTAAMAWYGMASLFATIGAPAGLAGVQLLAPARLRGRISTIFLAGTALVGIGAGPALVGLAADATGSLGTALGLAIPAAALLGITLAIAGRRSFAAQRTDP
jgi:MFS family permease